MEREFNCASVSFVKEKQLCHVFKLDRISAGANYSQVRSTSLPPFLISMAIPTFAQPCRVDEGVEYAERYPILHGDVLVSRGGSSEESSCRVDKREQEEQDEDTISKKRGDYTIDVNINVDVKK